MTSHMMVLLRPADFFGFTAGFFAFAAGFFAFAAGCFGRTAGCFAFAAGFFGFGASVVDVTPSSIQVGAWSLLCGRPRVARSTPAAFSFLARSGVSSRWSMRRPASRSNEFRQYFQKV